MLFRLGFVLCVDRLLVSLSGVRSNVCPISSSDGFEFIRSRLRNRGLVVVAVPSDDFKQELATNEDVREFCELQYGIDMPMSVITRVTGPDAHPFFRSLKAEEGFSPRWNFNKVLIGPDGAVVETYGSTIDPLSASVTNQIEALLP